MTEFKQKREPRTYTDEFKNQLVQLCQNKRHSKQSVNFNSRFRDKTSFNSDEYLKKEMKICLIHVQDNVSFLLFQSFFK